jgi:hypothetical protein
MLLVLLHSLVEKGLEALEDGELSCGSNWNAPKLGEFY